MNKLFKEYKVKLTVLFEDERPYAIRKPIGLVKVVEAQNVSNAIKVAVEALTDNYPELTYDNVLEANVILL